MAKDMRTMRMREFLQRQLNIATIIAITRMLLQSRMQNPDSP